MLSPKKAAPRIKSPTKSPKIPSRMALLKLLKENPYNLPPDDQLFNLKEENDEKDEKIHKIMVKRKLKDRYLPITSTQSSSKSNMAPIEETIQPVAAEHQRRLQMHGFVEQTREVLLAQIKIDRKEKEIERIIQQQLTEQTNIQNQIGKIAETTNQYEMTANSMKAEVQRARRNMENALTILNQIQKELKRKKASIARVKAEITQNEDVVFAYRNYGEFLRALTPKDEDPIEHFSTPAVLMQKIDQLENENLFLVQKCAEMDQENERAKDAVLVELEQAKAEKRCVKETKLKLPEITPIEVNEIGVTKESEEVETELQRLSRLVTNTYTKCFENKTDLNSLMMLERLENSLEDLYLQSDNIPQQYCIEKQVLIDKARREQARIEKTAANNREQKRKRNNAIKRAKLPIKRQTGRPLKRRIIPVTSHKAKDDQKKALDEKLQEEFLFGDILD